MHISITQYLYHHIPFVLSLPYIILSYAILMGKFLNIGDKPYVNVEVYTYITIER